MLSQLGANPPDNAVLDLERDLFQAFALARAHDAEAGLDAEFGAVRGAVEIFAVAVEEPVGQEIQRRALVRAGILVAVKRVAFSVDENFLPVDAAAETEVARGAIGNFLDPAQAERGAAGCISHCRQDERDCSERNTG